MVSEQKMKDLAQEILKTLQKVEDGNASLDEVETLYKSSRGLYERAILLKAKAFSGNDLSTPIVKEQPKKEPAQAPEPAQAQEEGPKTAQPGGEYDQEEKEASKNMPLFDFTNMGEEQEEEGKAETQPQPEPEATEGSKTESNAASSEQLSSVNDHQDVIDSINDAYKYAEDSSLLEDMKRQPITNLRTAIGINDKFSYINDLFNGENQLYEVALDHLEQLESADGAKHKLSELAIENEWDLESKTVMQFVELVERRYAAAE